ncbi:MAG: FixH family protein [Phycisphaerales bacterium]|nr:FixH family protein [Phycisphaerales bacterium]MCB9840104.1 FixH family protein [Phycisphaeraceae bacterium]
MATPTQPERSLAWLWPVGLIALMCGSVGICVATAVVAARDPSFALEPDYYDKALAWDESAAARAASDALGWTAEVEVSLPGADGAPDGARTVSLRLRDSQGEPVAADRVEIAAFHHARMRDIQRLSVGAGDPAIDSGPGTLVLAEAGRWVWSLGEARAGVWQVRVRAARGQDVFLATIDTETPDGARIGARGSTGNGGG